MVEEKKVQDQKPATRFSESAWKSYDPTPARRRIIPRISLRFALLLIVVSMALGFYFAIDAVHSKGGEAACFEVDAHWDGEHCTVKK